MKWNSVGYIFMVLRLRFDFESFGDTECLDEHGYIYMDQNGADEELL
jgi:hypothetical protein